jgi:hypothetical protein
MKLNPIICRKAFKLEKYRKSMKNTKVGHTSILLETCLTKKFETICAKEFMSFVSSVQHY